MNLRSSARAPGFWPARTNALVTVLLVLCANAACPAAESFPAATPESQGLSSKSLRELVDVVRGLQRKETSSAANC